MMLSGDSIILYYTGRYYHSKHGMKLFMLLVSVLLIPLLFSSCRTLEAPADRGSAYAHRAQQYRKIEGGGWLSVFLNLKEPVGVEINLDLTGVDVRSGDKWISLGSVSRAINSKHIGSGQIFIARNNLPAGEFDTIRLTFGESVLKEGTEESTLLLASPVVEMELPEKLALNRDDSHSLFVTWDVLSSMTGAKTFTPVMNTALQKIPLIQDLNYIACPDIDTIYVIRTDKNWVISSLGVTGRPTYLHINIFANRLYVLAGEEYAVKVVDIITNRIVDSFHISTDNEPNFMTVSPDKRYAYILDTAGGNIARMDLFSGALTSRATFYYKSEFAVFLEGQNKLAISSLEDSKVYILDPISLSVQSGFPVGSGPLGLLSIRDLLYVAESDSNTVSSYSLANYQLQNRTNVGFYPRLLLYRNNRIYATNFSSGSVTVMRPAQLNVTGMVRIDGKPQELAASESRNWIYVGNSDKGGISVIDATSNRETGFVELATAPAGMAVMD